MSGTRNLTDPEKAVLRFVVGGPRWIRSLGPMKGLADRLIEEGLLRRVKPPNGRGRNMVALTEEGQAIVFRMEGPPK